MNDRKLEKLHECLLLILDEIDRICCENNIPYFLDSGSALGAIRHGGFIPWDDDIDVGMLRENYDRFIQVAKEELSDRFFLQTTETESEYLGFNAKIRLNGTFFPEKVNEGKNIHQGIFVDVFPFDYISDNKNLALFETKISRRLVSIYLFASQSIKRGHVFKEFIRKVCKIIPQRMYRRFCLNFYLRHNEKRTRMVTCYSYKMNQHKVLHFNLQDMQTVHRVKFENKSYNIMDGYDSYLKTMYGNYMELPPVEKRFIHIDGDVEFGELKENIE